MNQKQKMLLLVSLLEKLTNVFCVSHYDFNVMGLLLLLSKDKEIGAVLAKPEIAPSWHALCKTKKHEIDSMSNSETAGSAEYLIGLMSLPTLIYRKETEQQLLMAAVVVLLVDIVELRVTFPIATQRCYDVLAGKGERKNPHLTEWMNSK